MRHLSFLRFSFVIFILFFSISVFGKFPTFSFKETIAFQKKDDIWQQFRTKIPYHLQQIIVWENENDDSKVIIISEPPSHCQISKLNDLADNFFTEHYSEIKQHTIGHDGWIKDILIVVYDDENFEDFIDELNHYLFFSDYKSDYFLLEEILSYKTTGNYNYTIPSFELKSWLEKSEFFHELDKPKKNQRINDLLNISSSGVYYSKKPGLVAWIFPKRKYLNFLKKEIRQFTLDSDIIIGALSNETSIAIIARERQTNLIEMPPLRIETILLLSNSIYKDELAQSYERNNVFAGKLSNTKDWAPIYLSPELMNTEFGSLLNITDQLLKSWSLNGTVAYKNFNYPSPSKWCYEKPISSELGVSSLTFNWNNKGAFYNTDYGNINYLGISKTGALPISYIPEGIEVENEMEDAVKNYETKAYNCFSNWQDPNLVRVVQYTTLFQVFKEFKIFDGEIQKKSIDDSNVFKESLESLFKEIQEVSETDIKKINSKIGERLIDLILSNQKLPTKNKKIALQILEQSLLPETKSNIEIVKEKINDVKEEYGEKGINLLIELLSSRKYLEDFELERLEFNQKIEESNQFPSYKETIDLLKRQREINEKSLKIHYFQQVSSSLQSPLNYLFVGFLSRDEIQKSYSNSFNSTKPKRFVKTPSVVISWDKLSVLTIGGHNLGTEKPTYRVSPNVKKGELKVIEENGKKVVLIHEQDLSQLSPELIKETLESSNTSIILRSSIAEVPVRPRETVLNRADNALIGGSGRGYITRREKRVLIKKLKLLSYPTKDLKQAITSFQKDYNLQRTGILDPNTTERLNKEINQLAKDLSKLGFRKQKPINNLNDYLKYNGKLGGISSKDFKNLIQKDKTFVQGVFEGKTNSKKISENGKEFLIVQNEVWEINKKEIIRRKKGHNGLKMIDAEINQKVIKESQEPNKVFAHINIMSPNSKNITLQIGDKRFPFNKAEFTNNTENFIKKFDAVISENNSLKEKKEIFIVADDLVNSEIAKQESSITPLVSYENFPTSSKLNPYYIVSKLNRHSQLDCRFIVSSSNMKLAKENTKNIPKIKGGNELGFVTSTKIDDRNIFKAIKAHLKRRKIRTYEDNFQTFEEGNGVIIIGHKNAEYRDYIRFLNKNQKLKGKHVFLLTCYTSSDGLVNSTLIHEGGMKGIMYPAHKVNPTTAKWLSKEIADIVSKPPNISKEIVNKNPNKNIYEIVEEAINNLLKKKTKPKHQKKLWELREIIPQFSINIIIHKTKNI